MSIKKVYIALEESNVSKRLNLFSIIIRASKLIKVFTNSSINAVDTRYSYYRLYIRDKYILRGINL